VRHDDKSQRVTVGEAARLLGITPEAVRARLYRGTLEREEGEDGTVYVRLYADQLQPHGEQSGDYAGESSALISSLEARIASLETQLDEANARERRAEERDRENRRLLAAALERIPPQLEAPSEPRESPETATETERVDSPTTEQPTPWWRRLFGG
jgi:septal ring factor EnvC (AmiA/AmiB activator)